MLLIWGSRLYGKVDAVPGVFFVATRFGHLWYLPLLPLSSHLVFDETDDGWRGVEIPMASKSVVVAWGRLALGVLAVVSLVNVFHAMGNGTGLAPYIVLLAGAVGLFAFSYRSSGIARATPERARELAALAGFGASALAELERVLTTTGESTSSDRSRG